MARLVAFHYQPRRSAAHRLDARFKLPVFLVLVAVTLHSGAFGLVVLTLFSLSTFTISRLPIQRFARDFRLFAVLLLVMFLVRSFGQVVGTASRESMGSAGVLVWRLAILVIYGSLLAATTRASHLQAAVAWYLRPLRFIPGGRIATMVGLTISLIPLVFDTYREISDAQTARCANAIRNPIRRLRRLSVPLLLKTFGRADEIGAAMEARCYTDRRRFAPLVCRPADWATTAVVTGVALAAMAATRFL